MGKKKGGAAAGSAATIVAAKKKGGAATVGTSTAGAAKKKGVGTHVTNGSWRPSIINPRSCSISIKMEHFLPQKTTPACLARR